MGIPASKGDRGMASTHPLWSIPGTIEVHLFIIVGSLYTVRVSSGFWVVTISGNTERRISRTSHSSTAIVRPEAVNDNHRLLLLPPVLDLAELWLPPPLI